MTYIYNSIKLKKYRNIKKQYIYRNTFSKIDTKIR